MFCLSAISLAGLFGTAGAALCIPSSSCPKLSDGLYCPVNNVTEHGDINRDVKEIYQHLAEDPPDYATAKSIYTTGKHSVKSDSMRTLQGLAQKDMTVDGTYTNAFYSGAVDLHGSTDAVWDDLMVACLDDTGGCKGKSDDFRKYVINKGAIGIVTAYATYEMGAALWKAADGSLTDSGAPYAWDEAAAFYIGNIEPVIGDGYDGPAPGNLYSPYEFNWKRDVDFPDGLETHKAAVKILNYGLLNIRGDGYNAGNLAEAQTGMYKIFAITAIRSAIKYSYKAYNDGTLAEKYLAEGSAYWRSASGYISSVVGKSAVRKVDDLLDFSLSSMPKTTPCEIKEKVEAMYETLGITCGMVGTWTDAPAGSCLAKPCSDGGNTATVPAGSEDYVDMCQGGIAGAAFSTQGPSRATALAVMAGAAALARQDIA
jgi:hypothetical protein